jgi:hypothetical protein
MKIISTLLLLTSICTYTFAQTTADVASSLNAQVFLDFEDGIVIPSDVSGVSVSNGSADVKVKIDGSFTTVSAVDNELVTDEGENVYFMDYDGYIKFDESILNSSSFSLAMDYKWSTNAVWYTGILSIVGYDLNDADEGDEGAADYESKQLLFKNSYSGIIDGFNLNVTTDLVENTYCHVVFTYAESIVKLYINGVYMAESSQSQVIDLWSDVSLYLGTKLTVDSDGAISPQLDGSGNSKNQQQYVDNIALFDYELSAEEVSAIYAGTTTITDIEDEVKMSDVEIYPNPVSDVLYVSSDDVSFVEIYNLGGVKVVATSEVMTGISLSGLSNGVYMVKCLNTSGEVISIQKVVKK